MHLQNKWGEISSHADCKESNLNLTKNTFKITPTLLLLWEEKSRCVNSKADFITVYWSVLDKKTTDFADDIETWLYMLCLMLFGGCV